MANWEQTYIDMGRDFTMSKVTFVFQGLEGMKEIRKFNPSCGCTNYSFDKKSKKLSVVLNTGKIPPHLKDEGYYTITKFISVVYMDDTIETLTITVKVKDGTLI